tara:strand:- start:257 stop:682 length:426 start_codon:yes stop_codon:yes gene_type:complete
MKVLFLDIDGVLNRYDMFEGKGSREIISDEMVARINRVVKETGCSVVISSSWRLIMSLSELSLLLGEHGFLSETIIDRTPHIDRRDNEILVWLRDHKDVTKFAVVDDEASDLTDVEGQLVQTSFDTGILDEHVNQLIEMLT